MRNVGLLLPMAPEYILKQVVAFALQGIRLAAGELTLRVVEERRRIAVGCQQGVMRQVRMKGGAGVSSCLLIAKLCSLLLLGSKPYWLIAYWLLATALCCCLV